MHKKKIIQNDKYSNIIYLFKYMTAVFSTLECTQNIITTPQTSHR